VPQVVDLTGRGGLVAAAGQLMTVAECAGQARPPPMTIYRMMNAGTVESTRIGRARRIYADSWTAYINSSKRVLRGKAPAGIRQSSSPRYAAELSRS
jgi:excisionase family DNA binding protein